MTYAELHVATHFSFLRGTSSCDELFAAAALLGLPAIAITDRNSVAGMVRALKASEATGTRLVCGCRLDLLDGTSLLVWPENRAGWSRLTRLLTLGKSRAVPKKGEKGQCFIAWEDVAAHSQSLVAALIPDEADEATARAMALVAEIFPARAYATLSYRRRPGDALRLHALDALARRHGVVPLATGDVLYHSPDRRILHDVVTAIRHGCTIDDLGFRRERNLDRHLKGPIEMARRFARWPEALRASEAVAERCTFSLRELDYQYPVEQVMTKRTPQQALERLTFDALATMFPGGVPDAYAGLARHELELIGRLGYAPYFLTVNSIVGFARSQGILCQGRGSAANSVVCFALGITSIDPVKHELLFERFVSGERDEPPDIDVDFEHERREEVIQWIYDTYGHNHAALTAVVSRFRTRGALREVGKALGLSEDVTAMIAGQIWHWSPDGVDHKHVAPLGLHLDDPRLALTLQLARELIGTPRHLSQHPGGFVLTDLRLDDLVPIEPAAMDERRVIEWDKDDIAILGFMKVDVLGLGMLGCMRRAFDLLEDHKGQRIGLVDLQDDDPATYEMIQRADTLGTFQIESRAQMNMLPRMKPKEFYDLVIEVAIVRPGPIQGDMVHPYLRRREGKEEPEYPKPELEAVLKKTLGVPLFQEQAMKVAIVGAGFTPAEADELRRSMATFKITDGVSHFRDRLIEGMVANGYQRDFAERTFKQIEGFGSYGFPESHAASFAKIAYASCWMKCHHPDVFTCALLNAQPMGFYAPAQIVRDARDHDVEVLPPCINLSRWDSYLIPSAPRRRGRAPCAAWEAEGLSKQRRLALSTSGPHPDPIPRRGEGELMPIRLGLRLIGGLSNDDGAAIVMARGDAPFVSIEDAWRRSGVPGAALERLAEADAFACIGIDRRQALWQVRGLAAAPLCLFAAADAREAEGEPEVRLRMMTAGREVVEDYRTIQLSLRAHPLHFLRADLAARGITACGDLAKLKDGARVEVSGIILVRQRPGSTDVVFITIEDETGVANIVVWASLFEKARRTIMSSSMIGVKGRLQREGIVIHVVAETIEDQTGLLRSVGDRDFRPTSSRGDAARHPGNDPRYPHADPRPQIRVKTRDFR